MLGAFSYADNHDCGISTMSRVEYIGLDLEINAQLPSSSPNLGLACGRSSALRRSAGLPMCASPVPLIDA
jgi:hypothetical protein